MIYGYARVSTKGQASQGNSLEAQEKALREHGATKIYKESYTGTVVDRPSFNELKSELKPGDTLMVTKLDRIARSISEGSELIKNLMEQDVKIHVLNMGLMDNTTTGRLVRNIFLAFAEFERDLIVERTSEGKAIAKLNPDFHEGRPKKYTKAQIDHALELLKTHSYKQVTNMTGISRATLQRAKNKQVS